MLNKFFPLIILFLVSILFFYKIVFFLKVPFPGDLLISEYSPWKYESYLGYNPGSYPNKAQYFDVIQQLYPWKMFAVEELKSGRFPLWNSYNFSGMPFFANSQSAVLNPFNLLFFIFNPVFAWTIFVYLQPLLASFFTYLYMRKLKLSVTSALLSSITFGYCLFFSVFLEYGNFGYNVLWLPLLLYLVECVYEKNKTYKLLLIPAILGIISFSGHLQLFLGILMFLITYILARFFFFKKNNRRSLWVLLVATMLGLGISAVQIVPTAELISNSARVTHDAGVFKNNILLQLYQFILFFAPDAYGNPATRNYVLSDSYPGNAIYVGIIPLLFSLYSLFYFKKNNYIKVYFIFTLVLFLFLSNNILSVFIYSFNIPIISSSSPSNYMFLLSFSLAVLAGFGVEEWTKKFDRRIFISFFILTILFLSLFFIHKIFNLQILQKQLLLGSVVLTVSGVLVVSVQFFKKQILVNLLIVVTILDLLYFFLKFNPFVPASFVYPKTSIGQVIKENKNVRSWGYSAANIAPNLQSILGIYSPEGYDPLYPKWYGQFIYSSKNGKLLENFSETTRSVATINNGYGERDLKDDENRLRILDATGVGLVLNRTESAATNFTFEGSRFQKIYQKEGWSIYKNTFALPHVFLTNSFDTYSTINEFNKKFDSKKVLLEKLPSFSIDKSSDAGTAKIIKYLPEQITIETDSGTNSLLVLLDTYYPGWKAFVDGKETPILKVNFTFRALQVTKGIHTVEFLYLPASVYWGTLITIISIITSVGFIFVNRKYGK